MVFGDDEKAVFDTAAECHICSQPFEDGDQKARDHCHFTGRFRGAAHFNCNLQYQISKQRYKLPVVFHNL